MASTADNSKKHRIRSKNEVVQLNDFFEELNEEYEEELRMRQNSGASVDETALLGDREIPFQFVDDDDESDSIGDDSASDTGSALSESDNALSDSAIDPALGKRRSRGSSDAIKRKESLGTIKVTTAKPDSASAANSDLAVVSSAASTSGDTTRIVAVSQTESTPAPVSKEDAVAAVQRSTSFIGSQSARPSIVNKLKSFWESTASPAPVPQTLTRTTSVVQTAAPATRPASASVSLPPSVSPSASSSSAAPVKKWAPVDARPAMAMAISVPGDRSTVPKEAPSANMVRTTSVVGFSGRGSSPLARTQSVAPATAQSAHSPSEPLKPEIAQTQPIASIDGTVPSLDSMSSPPSEPEPTIDTAPQPETQPILNNASEEIYQSPASVPEPKVEEVTSSPSPRSQQTPRAVGETSAEANGVEHTDPVSETATSTEDAKPDKEDSNSEHVDLAEAANLAVATAVEEASEPDVESRKLKLSSTPVSPSKPRRGTKGDSDRKLEKSQSEVPSTKTSAELETPVDKKKKRGSDKRRTKTDSAANDSGAEDSTREKDKKLRRTKKATESEEDVPPPKESTEVIVEPAEVKSKKRRKKLTSTTPGGTPTKRSSSTKKIKKSSSVAPDVPKTEATADAQRDAALASAGVAPKEIDKLKQFFSTWNSKDLMHTWEIDPTEIEFVERIGEGTSCSVYRGTYRGQEVALKVLKDINQKQLTNFTKEFDIISQFRSPYVVFFFGACIEPIPVMVLGFCRKGSLFHVLNNPYASVVLISARFRSQLTPLDYSAENITWDLVLKICLQTLRGLDSLHNWRPQIVHRDLKSRNILVEDDWNTKLCDFGESRYTQGTNLETLCKVRGTYAYIAPEVYFGQSFTTKSDVYAFGVILWELCNRCVKGKYDAPFSEYKSLIYDFQIIVQASRKGLRPTIDAKVPQALQNMIRVCWDHEPDNRPDTASILRFFEEIIAEPNQKKWLEVKHAPVYPPANGVGKPGAAPKSADEKK